MLSATKLFKNHEIKSELKFINIEDNETTVEIFKQVQIALELNKDLSIVLEEPSILIMRQEEKLRLGEQ